MADNQPQSGALGAPEQHSLSSAAAQTGTRQSQTLPAPQLPDGEVADHSDGTLHRNALEADLPLSMPIWLGTPGPGEGQSRCDVMWAAVRDDDPPGDDQYRVVDGQSVDADTLFPLALKIPQPDLAANGKHYLRIRVTHWNGTGNDFSEPIPLICDSRPPWGQDDPAPLQVPAHPVTDAWLAANGDKLIVGLEQYPDFLPGDRVVYYWGHTLPLARVASVSVGGDSWPMPLQITGDFLRQVGSGACYAQYELFDKATNRSRLSVPAAVEAVLGSLPGGLGDPVVPGALDGLLDLSDAVHGVTVQIPAFDDPLPGDRIAPTWGTTELAPVPLDDAPVFPLLIPVPAVVLRDTYGSASGVVDTPVRYLVRRGSLLSEVRSVIIGVDFSVIGPGPDPGTTWPDPVNGALTLAEVRGKRSDLPNVLTLADHGEAANLTFTLYQPLNAGELVSFYWHDTEVSEARYRVKDTDTPSTVVTVQIPWYYIEQAGNHVALPVHYRIAAPGSGNQQHSAVTSVSVSALPAPQAPTFQGLYNGALLTCDSLYANPGSPHPLEPAVRVEVPDLSQPPYSLREGDSVTLHWIALAGQSGETFLEGTELEETVILDSQHSPGGFVWRVQPYATHILPTYDPLDPTNRIGRGRASYRFLSAGRPVVSLQAQALVAMVTSNGPCPVPQRLQCALGREDPQSPSTSGSTP